MNGPGGPSDDVALLRGIATTRTIRRYTDEPISDLELSRVLYAASRAPSGSNRQPFRFLVLRDGERAVAAKRLLGRAFREGWNTKNRSDGYETGSGADPTSPKARQAATMQRYVERFESVPVVVLVGLVRYREPSPYEGASVYPACQNLLLAARAVGLGGALTMWHLAVERELRQLLEIPEEVALSACITLGRPEGSHGPVRRRPLVESVFDDRWGVAATWIDEPEESPHPRGPSTR